MNSTSIVTRIFAWASCLAALGASAASLQLREAVSTVTVSASAEGNGQSLALNTAVAAGQFVRTGQDSRAEFVTDKGVLRLGSGTSIQLPEQDGQIQLQQGTALFDGKQTRLTVKLDDQPVTIEGGTGFAMLLREGEGKPSILHVGTLAGRTVVRRGGKSIALAPAQVLSLAAGGQTSVGAFNLAKQFESSTLVNGFQSPLPGRKSLEREAARFVSLQRRGFVQPASLAAIGNDLHHSIVENNRSGDAGQIGGLGQSGNASVSGQFSAVAAGFGFQSRTAILAAASTTEKGNNGLGNGQDPPTPGWLNPRNPHFGTPQNDGPGHGPGNPGNRGGR